MSKRVPRRQADDAYPETFLPRKVARAADRATDEVLAEDFMLREFGIFPERGRSR